MAFKDHEAHRAWMKQWYLQHKEDVRKRNSEYEKSNRDKINARKRVYRQRPEIAEHLRAYNLKRYHDSPEYRARSLQLAAQRRSEHRARLIKFLGGICKRCGFDDSRALQVDHIKGGGRKEFRDNPKFLKAKTYMEEVRLHPEKYQLLCANCNWIKRYENNEIPRYN